MKDIQEIKQNMIATQKLCMRGVFEVCAVNKKAIKPLLNLKSDLEAFLKTYPENVDAMRFYCYVQCYLLNFKTGLAYLKRTSEISCDIKDKQNLIRLTQIVESLKEIVLTPNELVDLGEYLEKALLEPCDHSLKHTKEWLAVNIEKKNHAKVIKGLQNAGGYCDCEVLANVIV